MNRGKNGAKNEPFLNSGGRAEKIVLKHSCLHVVCENTANTGVFGWFALRVGSKKMKKTVVFTIHFKPLVAKTSQKTVFSTHSLKKQWK